MSGARQTLTIDLSNNLLDDLTLTDFTQFPKVIVKFPLSSFGVTNSLLDISADLLDASWILEQLARKAVRITTRVGSGYYQPLVTATLYEPHSDLGSTLTDCALIVGEGENLADPIVDGRIEELRSKIADFEDEIHAMNFRVPEMADWYFVNLVASYGESYYETPDFVVDQVRRFPERRIGFHRSAYSTRLGGSCYASHDAWVVPVGIGLDKFFKETGQKYRLKTFIEGQMVALNGRTVIRAGQLFVTFPARRYFASRVCAGFALTNTEDSWSDGPFGWGMSTGFRDPAAADFGAAQLSHDKFRPAGTERYLVDATGTMIVVDDGMFQHVFSEVAPLNQLQMKNLLTAAGQLAESLSVATGISGSATFDWRTLSDDKFEELCYDIIYAHPKFDSDTIRKFGKVRSRDGGRDIEVQEVPNRFGAQPRRWIFQCKLITDGSSLGKSKVLDIGDMLVQYGANGFGVMTNTVIDSTLYDKLRPVCRDRQVSELHFSRLEIERTLVANPALKKKYFPD